MSKRMINFFLLHLLILLTLPFHAEAFFNKAPENEMQVVASTKGLSETLERIKIRQDLLKEKNRLKCAVVFGGGGAKGAAEVGVLKYIEQSGIKVDYVVGTSIGSIVGGLYSLGYDSKQLEDLFRSQQWLSLLTDRQQSLKRTLFEQQGGTTYILGIPVYSQGRFSFDNKFGALKGDSIVSVLDRMTACPDSINFDYMPRPFRCVAVDINTKKEVVLSKGKLSLCMRASMAIPMVYSPIEMNGQVLVDGGLLNNLPVDVARQMGADIVIAIDLTQKKQEEDLDALAIDESIWKSNGLPYLLNWVLSRPDMTKYNKNRKDADVYINPDLGDMNAASFTYDKIVKMLEEGEKAGKKALPALKKAAKRQMEGKPLKQ